ncbi:MAG TPA: hypothetical protein VGF33_10840 [Caulobacteraceae bacterium]|jgi:hypothetical protein
MNLTATLILVGAALASGVACGWLGARPAKPFGAPRLIPWRLLMLVAFALALAALVHAVALLKPQ